VRDLTPVDRAGYFFLSGLESIAKSLAPVKELRLLIGNTTNRETLEQIAEGYRRLDLVSDKAEEQSFPKKTETKRMAAETAENIRATAELMDQTDEAEATVKTRCCRFAPAPLVDSSSLARRGMGGGNLPFSAA
jgi:hypothetical protein